VRTSKKTTSNKNNDNNFNPNANYPFFDFDNITKLEFLGKGHFGKVVKAYEKATGEFLAIKIYKKPEEELEDIILEDNLMKNVEAINKKNQFLRYLGLFRDRNQIGSLNLIMESGVINLEEILSIRKYYNLPNVFYLFKSFLDQLIILEENGIANRDLKTENVILVEDKSNKGRYIYKISDFGIGCKLAKGIKMTDQIRGFTKRYASPEVLMLIKESQASFYNPFKADVYSLGILILHLLGDPSFIYDDDLKEILMRMVDKDPNKRPSYEEILISLQDKNGIQPEDEKSYIKNYQEERDRKKGNDKNIEKKLEYFEAYFNIYHLEKAEELINECLNLEEEKAPEFKNTDFQLKSFIGKGKICQRDYLAKCKEAVEWHEKAEKLCLSLYGKTHEEYGKVCLMLGDDYYEINNFEQAEKSYRKAKDALMSTVDKNLAIIEFIHKQLIKICCFSGLNFVKFKDLLKEEVMLYDQNNFKNPWIDILRGELAYAEITQLQNTDLRQIQNMAKIFKPTVIQMIKPLKKTIQGCEFLEKTELRKRNVLLFLLVEEYAECENILLELTQIYKDYYGINHIKIVASYQNLASLFWRFAGESKKAESYFKKAFEFMKKTTNNNEIEGDLCCEYAEFLKYNQKNDEDAQGYYEKALSLFEENEEKSDMIVQSLSGNLDQNSDLVVPRVLCQIFK